MSRLHKVVLPIRRSILIALLCHVLLCKHVIVSMLFLPLHLLPLLCLSRLLLALQTMLAFLATACTKQEGQGTSYLLLRSSLILLSNLSVVVVLFLLQVWLALYLGLVEAVDNGVFTLRHMDALHELLVLKADLADVHGAVLFQVRPWRVDDGDVVLLVAFYRVGLGQLRKVHQQLLR